MKARTKQIIQWIRNQVPKGGKVIIGISGGKDSTITAALCAKAVGVKNVVGVMMPNVSQTDIADSMRVCTLLGISSHLVNIGPAYNALSMEVARAICADDEQPLCTVWNNSMFISNTPARLRMVTLYAVAALYPNSRVVNTCNFSEDYVGYSTKYGDAAGDFSPLGHLTVREVLEIGDDLGLPYELVHKMPSDGMCGKSDEDNLGFTYEELDAFLLDFKHPSPEKYERIMQLHKSTRHKYKPMPTFGRNEEE